MLQPVVVGKLVALIVLVVALVLLVLHQLSWPVGTLIFLLAAAILLL